MIAGGVVLATGMPRWAARNDGEGDARECLLLLGGSGCDLGFIDGVKTATERAGSPILATIMLAPDDFEARARFFGEHAGRRVLGIMDDAAYALFHEGMRAAGAQLAYLGRHAAGPGRFASRHALLSTPALPGIGIAIARGLADAGCSFLLRESRLGAPERDLPSSTRVPGFRSYEIGARRQHALHVSGMSVASACELAGIDRACVRAGSCGADVPPTEAPHRGWDETVGGALSRALLGTIPAPLGPGDQHTFVHRCSGTERAEPVAACVTFVIDV